MNTIWSTYVQGADLLYQTRSLRFSDLFKEKYVSAFDIGGRKDILEIGCGPGALAQALHRWYPDGRVTGIDRDSSFIEFAKQKAPDITFAEGDATALAFADGSFDITVSNTVAEHIEPSKFFGEQYRVLCKNGICLVLSARRGVNFYAPCISEQSDFEKEIWSRASKRLEEIDREYNVCPYPMTEQEYPLCMEKYGFRNVSTEYITVNLTPDNPAYSKETAHAMINANRQSQLDGINMLKAAASDLVSDDEIKELIRLTNQKYDKRLELYDSGIKQWDTNVSVTMIMRGIK